MAALTLLIRSPDAKAEHLSVHWMRPNENRCPLHVCPTHDNSIADKKTSDNSINEDFLLGIVHASCS